MMNTMKLKGNLAETRDRRSWQSLEPPQAMSSVTQVCFADHGWASPSLTAAAFMSRAAGVPLLALSTWTMTAKCLLCRNQIGKRTRTRRNAVSPRSDLRHNPDRGWSAFSEVCGCTAARKGLSGPPLGWRRRCTGKAV